MGKQQPSGSINVAAGSDLRFLGTVLFDWAVIGKPKGTQMIRISVSAFDTSSGAKIWGALLGDDSIPGNQPTKPATVVLGEGGNAWQERGGGPARCEARLALYARPGHEGITYLDTVEFDVGA